MLDKGEELDWFHSSAIVALGLIAAIGFCAFIVWELVENSHPVVDLRLFGRRNFWTGTLAFALGYAVFFGNVVILPLWLQTVHGLHGHRRQGCSRPRSVDTGRCCCRRLSVGASARPIRRILGHRGVPDLCDFAVHAHAVQHSGKFRLPRGAQSSCKALQWHSSSFPLGQPDPLRAAARRGFPPPRACRTLRAFSPGASARRSPPRRGITAPSCITRS